MMPRKRIPHTPLQKVSKLILERTSNFILEHQLGTSSVIVQVFNAISGDMVVPDIRVVDDNTVQVRFSVPVKPRTYRVVVIG